MLYATTAYALKTNLYAGAAIGGLSVLIDKVSTYIFGGYVDKKKFSSLDAFSKGKGMVVSAAFFYGLRNKYAPSSVKLTFSEIFLTDQISRTLGDIANRRIYGTNGKKPKI